MPEVQCLVCFIHWSLILYYHQFLKLCTLCNFACFLSFCFVLYCFSKLTFQKVLIPDKAESSGLIMGPWNYFKRFSTDNTGRLPGINRNYRCWWKTSVKNIWVGKHEQHFFEGNQTVGSAQGELAEAKISLWKMCAIHSINYVCLLKIR